MEKRPGYSAKQPLPEDAIPPTESGVPAANGHQPPVSTPIERSGLRARITLIEPKLHVQVQDANGDCLHQLSYTIPSPLPRADPEGKGRTPGERVDELIARSEEQALKDWMKLQEEAAAAAR